MYIYFDDLKNTYNIKIGLSQVTTEECAECCVRSRVLNLDAGTAALYTCNVSLPVLFYNRFIDRYDCNMEI